MADGSPPPINIWDLPHHCKPLVSVLHGHTRPVTAVKLFNRLIVSGSEDGNIRVWDAIRLACVHCIPGAHVSGVAELEVMGDNLVSSGCGRMLKMWDPKTWRPLAICDGGAHLTALLAWDGEVLVTGREDGQVLVWHRDEWQRRTLLGGDAPHANKVTAMVRVRDKLVTGSLDHSIKVWAADWTTTSADLQAVLVKAMNPFAEVSTMCVVRQQCERPALVSTDRRGKTKHWDTVSWKLKETLASLVRFPVSTSSYDGLLFNGSSDGTFTVLSLDPIKAELASVAHGKGDVADCFVTEGTLVTASDDFTVRLHDSTSITLRTIAKDDTVTLRRMLVVRRTLNFSRAQNLLTALMEYAELSKWRNLSFVEFFVAHGVYPTPTALRLLHAMGGSQWLANCAFLDVDRDGYLSVEDLVTSLSVDPAVAALYLKAGAREIGRPSVSAPIGVLDLMAGGSTMLRRLMAMASATWLFQSPGAARQHLRFLDVSSFIPLLSKHLNIQDRCALAVCSHSCHAVCSMPLTALELAIQGPVNLPCLRTLAVTWNYGDRVPGHAIVQRPFPANMIGHGVRALVLRSVPLSSKSLCDALSTMPSLTSIDVLAPADFAPHIDVGMDALRFIGESFPELIRLKLVYPGADRIPMEMSHLSKLTRFVVDSDTVVTPPQEVTELSADAIRSFLQDLRDDGPAAFLHAHLVVSGARATSFAGALHNPEKWVAGGQPDVATLVNGNLVDLVPGDGSQPPLTASLWDFDQLGDHLNLYGMPLSAWRTLFIACVDAAGDMVVQLAAQLEAIEAYTRNSHVMVVVVGADREPDLVPRVNEMLASVPNPRAPPRRDPYGDTPHPPPLSSDSDSSDSEDEGVAPRPVRASLRVPAAAAVKRMFDSYSTDSYLHRRDYSTVRGWTLATDTPKATVVGAIGANFASGTVVTFGEEAPPCRPLHVPNKFTGCTPTNPDWWSHRPTTAAVGAHARLTAVAGSVTTRAPAGLPALVHALHTAVFDNLKVMRGEVPKSYAMVAKATRLIREEAIGAPPRIHPGHFAYRRGDDVDRGAIGWRSSLLHRCTGPNSHVDREELVAQLYRLVAADHAKLRRAVAFLHQVSVVHARDVVCPSGGLNLTVYLEPQFMVDVMRRAFRLALKHRGAPVASPNERKRRTALEEHNLQSSKTTRQTADTTSLVRSAYEGPEEEFYDLLTHELWLGAASLTVTVTGYTIEAMDGFTVRNLSQEQVLYHTHVLAKDRNGDPMAETTLMRRFSEFRRFHIEVFEEMVPRSKRLPDRPVTTVVTKQRYLTEEFCAARVEHLNQYLAAIEACEETISRDLRLLRFFEMRVAMREHCDATGKAPAAVEEATFDTHDDDGVMDVAAMANVSVMSPKPQYRARDSSSLMGHTVHLHHHTAFTDGTGIRFVDVNDDAMFTSGTLFWEKNLLRFLSIIPKLHPSDMELAKAALGGEEPPMKMPGLTETATEPIVNALRDMKKGFGLLMPFAEGQPVDTILGEWGKPMMKFLDLVLPESAIHSETWFNIFNYVWSQARDIENPLRHAETDAWVSVFTKHCVDIARTEIGNRQVRSVATGHFLGVERALLSPADGESVGNVVAQVLPAWLGLTFYKLDQIRVDMAVTHYHTLRGAFEHRQAAHASGMSRTRRWVHEVFRPASAVLTDRMVWDAVLDSQPAKLSVVMEGLLLVLGHRHLLTAVAERRPASDAEEPPLCTAAAGPPWDNLPFPEVFATDAEALEAVQNRMQRMAVVAAVSTAMARALLKAPVLSSDTWEYVYDSGERGRILGVLDDDDVRELQGGCYHWFDFAETRHELRVGMLAGLQVMLNKYDKALTPDVYGELVAEIDAALDLNSPSYKRSFYLLCAEVRSVTAAVMKGILCPEVDVNELNEWLVMWEACAGGRVEGMAAVTAMYPPLVCSIFKANITSIGQVFARFVRRNTALFGPYMRVFIGEMWTRNRALPAPVHLVGSE